jgi:hypothetical protein
MMAQGMPPEGAEPEMEEQGEHDTVTCPNCGAKLIIESNRMAAQRLIDEHDFRSAWMADPRNNGNLQGADVAFNKAFPATSYMDRVLKDFGLDSAGKFTTPEAVRSAFHRGLLTQKQAEDLIKQQFPAGRGQ